jgi:hypothetical protein
VNLADITASFAAAGFVIRDDRSIHDPQSIAFLRDIVGAGDWVINLLSHGLAFDWATGPPTAYVEPNNKSATTNMAELRSTVATWEAGGFVQRLSAPPLCVNPMTVAVQYNATTDTTKYRPCIDLSRHVNLAIEKTTVKLDDLSLVQELIEPEDYMTSLDLENQYFQVRLRPDMFQYMGFMVPAEDGTPQFFQFTVMAYGCKPAVTVVTRLLRPIKAFLHRHGVKFSIYIDDGRISAATPQLCSEQMQFTLLVLQLAGWRVQWKKTTLIPTNRLLHLGFITDSVQMAYSITPEKWETVRLALTGLIEHARKDLPVPVKDVASVLGKVGALHRSHGSIVRVLSRSLQHQLGCHVDEHGWTGHLQVTQASISELTLLLQQLPFFHGCFIPTVSASTHAYELQDVLNATAQIAYSDANMPDLLVSDASTSSAFIFLADGTFRYVADFPFTADQSMASSSMRELLALAQALTRDGPVFLSAGTRIIFWQTDNQACTWFIQHGSRNPAIQRVVFTIKCKERDYGIRVVPVWTPRLHPRLVLADVGSRLSSSTDEWSVDRTDLAGIFAFFGFSPDTDCYAASQNAISPHFFSKVPQTGSAGIDFLAQSPTTVNLFLCPPVSGIISAFHHVLSLRGKLALLLVPDWPSTAFWAVLHPGGKVHPSVQCSKVFYPRFFSANSVPTLFTSGARIPLLALLIRTF